ncbi:MAG: AAA family ATPase [Cytophagales bacterium]|nr:AAA family ATPase [Cytophagales bacterium]
MADEFVLHGVNEPVDQPIIFTNSRQSFVDLYVQDLVRARTTISQHKGIERKIITDQTIIQLYEKWVEKFGFKEKQIKEHLYFEESSLSSNFKTSYRFRELLEHSREAGDWLVPSFFQPSALYTIFAPAKVGKTTFILDLKYAVLVSGVFLGIPTKKGKVLDISLEEGVSLSAMKMVERGFDDDEASFLKYTDVFRIEKSFNLLEDIPKLEQMIYDFKPTLVTFDSLRMMLAGTGISENSSEIAPLMYRLHQVFIKSGGATGILLHHKNKSGKDLDGASGHSSIASANDGLFKLSKIKNEQGQTRTEMQSFPRNGLERTLVLAMVRGEGGRWHMEIESEKDADPVIEAWVSKIIRVLTSKPHQKYTNKELRARLGITKCSEYEEALIKLREMCIIEVERINKEFVYSIPENSAWFDNESSLLSHISNESRLADTLAKCKTRQDLRILSKEWTTELKQSVVRLLSDTEKELVKTLSTTCPYHAGDEVVYNGVIVPVVDSKFDEKTKTFYFLLQDNGDEWVSEDDLSMMEETVKEKVEEIDPQDSTLF